MSSPAAPVRNPWLWVPSSYLSEGIPFAMVIWVAGTMFKDLGHTDGQITLATASIGIAWSLKPLWAAFLDMYRTKKFFVLAMELLMAVLLAGIAACLPLPNYFQITIAVLWVLAFASATQDICVDGIYITSLDEKKQAAFIGVQGVFWNVGRLFGTALIVYAAGSLKADHGMSATAAWGWALGLAAVTLTGLAAYHWFILPTGTVTKQPHSARGFDNAFLDLWIKRSWLVGRLAGAGVIIYAANLLNERFGFSPESVWTWCWTVGLLVVTIIGFAVNDWVMHPSGAGPDQWFQRIWKAGRLLGAGAVIYAASLVDARVGFSVTSHSFWLWTLGKLVGLGICFSLNDRIMHPTGSNPVRYQETREIARTFMDTIVDFFRKESIWGMLIFVFLYRSSEGLLLIEGPLFLQASPDAGGVGLTLKEKGIIDGTISTFVSLGAGLLGGAFMAKFGLKRNTLIFMALCLNLPHITFVILSQLAGPGHTLSLVTVGTLVTIEKFGYSFGFVANMLYMMQQISPGKYHMTHYAFCTALMNLMLVPTQMISGPLADHFGYKTYFIIVMFAAIPSVLAACYAPFPRKPDNGHPA